MRKIPVATFALLALVTGASAGFALPQKIQAQQVGPSLTAAEAPTTDTGATTTDTTATDDTSKIGALNDQVKSKDDQVNQLQGIIDTYEKNIADEENQKASLTNEVQLLDNQVIKKQYDIQQTQTEQEETQLQIQALNDQIELDSQHLVVQKDEASDLIRSIHQEDGIGPLEVLLTQKSLSAFFDKLEEDKRLENDLDDAMNRLTDAKSALQKDQKDLSDKNIALTQQAQQLSQEQLALQAQRNFKAAMVTQTGSDEAQFEQMLNEVQAEQQTTSNDVSDIESKLKDKLDNINQELAQGQSLLTWPVDPTNGITCRFHDPNYPFNNLFPHPGIDLAVPVGTPVHAAASGYVAWNKTGHDYGNYTMVIHPGGIATVYAHLSQFLAKPDSYVQVGDVIGLSGGKPGAPGAGLTTGPHLHFEVRQNGIPVDPENYEPTIPDNDFYSCAISD
ncbi:MAG: peptidoglycan DD-metalloendopeptidase family protein [Patescibacteria group bacterium]